MGEAPMRMVGGEWVCSCGMSEGTEENQCRRTSEAAVDQPTEGNYDLASLGRAVRRGFTYYKSAKSAVSRIVVAEQDFILPTTYRPFVLGIQRYSTMYAT